MSAPLSPEDIRVLKSLTQWWDQAGVDVLAPLPEERPRRSEPRREAAPSEQRPAPPARATPQAARAAGYGAPAPSHEDARAIATKADTLDALKAALNSYEGCPLKVTATQLVFARGNPQARVMVVGEGAGARGGYRRRALCGPVRAIAGPHAGGHRAGA